MGTIIAGYLCQNPKLIKMDDGETEAELRIHIPSYYDDIGAIYIVYVRGDYVGYCQEYLQKDDCVVTIAQLINSTDESCEYQVGRLVCDFVKCMKFQDCVEGAIILNGGIRKAVT